MTVASKPPLHKRRVTRPSSQLFITFINEFGVGWVTSGGQTDFFLVLVIRCRRLRWFPGRRPLLLRRLFHNCFRVSKPL